jgi:hypothetical protein
VSAECALESVLLSKTLSSAKSLYCGRRRELPTMTWLLCHLFWPPYNHRLRNASVRSITSLAFGRHCSHLEHLQDLSIYAHDTCNTLKSSFMRTPSMSNPFYSAPILQPRRSSISNSTHIKCSAHKTTSRHLCYLRAA